MQGDMHRIDKPTGRTVDNAKSKSSVGKDDVMLHAEHGIYWEKLTWLSQLPRRTEQNRTSALVKMLIQSGDNRRILSNCSGNK